MTAATEVISRLQARGVTLQRDPSGGLRVTGVSRLSEQEKATLKVYKAALLQTLAATEPVARTPAETNRLNMPGVTTVVDEVRRVFGDGVRCVYAKEGDRELGRLPDGWPPTEEPRP